jgi:hypothetical protein
MANTQRRNVIRSIDYQITNVSNARDVFVSLANQFKEPHPEYFDMFMRLADYLDKFIPSAQAVKDTL